MNFNFITIYVNDMEASMAFYQGLLGLDGVRRPIENGGELAFLGEEGKPQIEILYRGPGAPKTDYSGFSIGFAVEDLDAATQYLADHGHPCHRGPISPGPGTRFSFFRDPNGIEIQLIEHK